jgi:lysophospholipase L1-like esterase
MSRSRVLPLAVVAASSLVALAAAELLLRAAGYTYSPIHIEVAPGNDWRDEHAFRDASFTYDPVLIWRPKSGQFAAYNHQGFRGAPIDQKKPEGSIRLISLGDSNTFGWADDPDANWPAALGRLMAGDGRRAEVVNAAVWGYSSFQGLRRFAEIVDFAPDIVLVSFGANDAHQVAIPDAEYVRSYVRSERIAGITSRSRVGQVVVAAWDRAAQLTNRREALVSRVGLTEYRANLQAMIDGTRRRGIQLVLLTRPFTGSTTDPRWWKTHAPAYNAVTLETGRAAGIPVVDVYGAFRDTPQYFDDESHFGAEGHQRAAALIYDAIKPLLR